MASMSAYTRMNKIGRGSYGDVFKVTRNCDGKVLVIKEVSLLGISKEEESEILNETEIIKKLDHRHIVSCIESFIENDTLHIVMEYASGGDLAAVIKRNSASGMFISEEQFWSYLIQITLGLQHMHSRRVLHRDVKASNIFLDKNGDIKIGDLGLGKILSSKTMCAISQVGTPIYFSPEICEGRPYDAKSDVWALGCLLFELVTCKPPFQASNQPQLLKKIVNDQPEVHVPAHYSREIPFIISKLLDKDPRKRPSPDSILSYSAVQIRIERAQFKQREMDLLKQVDDMKRAFDDKKVEVEALAKELSRSNRDNDTCQRENRRLQDRIQSLEDQIGILKSQKGVRTADYQSVHVQTSGEQYLASSYDHSATPDCIQPAQGSNNQCVEDCSTVNTNRADDFQEDGVLFDSMSDHSSSRTQERSATRRSTFVPTPCNLFVSPALVQEKAPEETDSLLQSPSVPGNHRPLIKQDSTLRRRIAFRRSWGDGNTPTRKQPMLVLRNSADSAVTVTSPARSMTDKQEPLASTSEEAAAFLPQDFTPKTNRAPTWAVATPEPHQHLAEGCIRARARTPQTSLGPAKRVPRSDADDIENVNPSEGNSRSLLHTDSKAICRRYNEGGNRVISSPLRSYSPQAWEELQGRCRMLKEKCLNPNSVEKVRPGSEKKLSYSTDMKELSSDVEYVLALTEGLRRSAQKALYDSSNRSVTRVNTCDLKVLQQQQLQQQVLSSWHAGAQASYLYQYSTCDTQCREEMPPNTCRRLVFSQPVK